MSSCRIVVILLVYVFATASYASTFGEVLDPNGGYLDCDNLVWYEKAVCEKVADEISQELNSKGVLLENGNLVYYKSPIVASQSVDTGHSCTHRAYIGNSESSVKLLSSGSLSFKGSSVDTPFLMYAHMPVNVYGRINLKETWGVKVDLVVGSTCVDYAEDNYYVLLNNNTTMNLRILMSMEPKYLGVDENGNYRFKIKPLVNVAGSMPTLNTEFSIHEKNGIFSGFLTYVTGGFNYALNLFDDTDQFLDDVVYSVSTIVVELLESEIESETQEAINSYIARQGDNVTRTLENDLHQEISYSLGLDGNGEREYVVNKSVARGRLAAVLETIVSLNLN